jgi:hypothetical protein
LVPDTNFSTFSLKKSRVGIAALCVIGMVFMRSDTVTGLKLPTSMDFISMHVSWVTVPPGAEIGRMFLPISKVTSACASLTSAAFCIAIGIAGVGALAHTEYPFARVKAEPKY